MGSRNSVSSVSPGGKVLTKPYWNTAFSGSSVCAALWQRPAPSQTHTQIHSEHNSRPTRSHAVWAGIVFVAPCFQSTKAISIVQSWTGAQWACVSIRVFWCVGPSAYAEGHENTFAKNCAFRWKTFFFPECSPLCSPTGIRCARVYSAVK